ncbi:MAG: hypothetical protein K8S99_09460 [Planctomycetes bacterium]|nr:hypothetical protein [Planctomycetota bacterium]
MHTLACGPYISNGFLLSVATLLIIKPVTYFAFIQAFRYRVTDYMPMSYWRVAGLALLRAGVGAVIIGACAFVLAFVPGVTGGGKTMYQAWSLLIAERLGIWYLIGAYCAALTDRRLLGWTLSGTAIDMAYDVGIVYGMDDNLWINGVILIGLVAFLVPLHIIGRRNELRNQFSREPRCRKCSYNLTGNLSGMCPECGEPVRAASA